MNIAILGFGARGHIFADYIMKMEDVNLTHICDCLDIQIEDAINNYGVKKENCYKDYKEFFKQGKLADALIIATQDKDHIKHTLEALDLGYDILLEKPAATTYEDCVKIRDRANLLGRKVMIAHVLRYTTFYSEMKKVLDSKRLGDIVSINQTENVGYWHMAHSYVRGAWRKTEESSPMILAKCCHDIDIFCWLIGKKCKTISSFGALNFYKEENAPEGSTKYCVDCKLKGTCPYDCFTIYKNRTCSIMGSNSVVNGKAYSLDEMLSNHESQYGRCVFRCDNDVVDHQVVNLLFDNNITAHLSMIGFSEDCYRYIKVFCTYGEVYGNIEEQKLYIQEYGKELEIIDLTKLCDDFSCHQGGDKLLIYDFINYIKNEKSSKALTTIDDSIESHLLCFKAEESRLNKGKSIDIEN